MPVGSSDTSLGIALHPMADLSTLLARLAISAARLDTYLVTALARQPMVTLPVTPLTLL